MSYQVIARKWRPQSFSQLVGQDHVSQTLLNALRSGRLPHALLFSGARGVGKTSSARIFAKSLRCPNQKDFVPCGVCPTCEDIANGSDMNVIEIDGASNNGVDAIRELRETVGFMPSSGKYKVYIIDEVHMLSTSAFNALLKTLEEPPAHVVFIFATTEPQKIPVTILSRCQRFDFRRIPTRQIAERLKLICETDGVKFQEEALFTIARQAEGALRDSQSLLDQAITFCEGNISLEKVTQVLGLSDRSLLREALESLVHRDVSRALQVVRKVYDAGYDASVFAQDLLELIRHLLIVRLDGQQAEQVVDLADTEIKWLADLSKVSTAEETHLLFDMALKGIQDLTRAQNTRIVFEMLLLRMAQAPKLVDLNKLLAGQVTVTPTTAPTRTSTQQQVAPQSVATATPAVPEVTTNPNAGYDASLSPQENWIRLVTRIKGLQPALGARLDFVSLIELTTSTLSLGSRDKMILNQLADKSVPIKIQSYIKTFWNKSLEVAFSFIQNSDAPPSPKEAEQQEKQQKNADLMKSVENHPVIKKTQEVFKAKIESIKERS